MNGVSLSRFVLPAAALALAVLAVLAVLDRLGENERAAERQTLLARAAALEQTALAPGSVLPCVDGTSGETVGNACEKKVFANPQTAAAAVAYMSARIDLLREAYALARHGDNGALAPLASTRRAVGLDRYGIAAHVLSQRDGCTATKCAVFAMLDDADALKANLKAGIFEQYVSRYAASWRAPAPAKGPAVSALPSAVPNVNEAARTSLPQAGKSPADEARAEVTPPGAAAPHKPVSSRWHFPSADSIPAVSIMNAEPKLPKDVAAQLARDTAKKTALERRKVGKAATAKPSAQESKSKESKNKDEGEKKPQEPGPPLQLTR